MAPPAGGCPPRGRRGGGPPRDGREGGRRRRLRARAARRLAPPLGRLATIWAARRRARFRPAGRPLPADLRAALDPFFPSATLDDVRLTVVPAIPGPPLGGLLRRLGFATADFARVVGITFADTIVVADRLKGPALVATVFHELVHVEQVRRLGLGGFMRRYVEGWLATGRYAAVSLERNAYDLQRRFERAPREPFDVSAEVGERLLSSSSAGATPARRTPRSSAS